MIQYLVKVFYFLCKQPWSTLQQLKRHNPNRGRRQVKYNVTYVNGARLAFFW